MVYRALPYDLHFLLKYGIVCSYNIKNKQKKRNKMDKNNLEEMLGEAKVAQGSTELGIENEKTQATITADAGLEASLSERDDLTVERRVAEDERLKAADLLAQGTEATAGSEVIAPQMQEFLSVADRTVEERRDALAQLNKKLETLDSDPAVMGYLRQEADDENRRIDLQVDYQTCNYITPKGSEHGGTLEAVLNASKPEYEITIAGTNIGDNPLCQLELYAFQASRASKVVETAGPIEDAEDAVGRLVAVRNEAESGNPDIAKIDTILAEFLFKRLEHFFATLDQRVDARAQEQFEFYQANPDKAAEYHVTASTPEAFKEQLTKYLGDINGYMESARLAMEGTGSKAKLLARIGDEVFQRGAGPLKSSENRPFAPDNYKAPSNTDQLAA